MKIKHKKLVASGTAAALAGVLGIGALLQTSVSVQASSAMMPGIEQIVSDNSDSKNPFKILEIVDSTEDAEIGYYISGQEPYIKLYTYSYEQDGEQKSIHFSSLQDGLEKLPKETLRRAFATNVKLDENGQIDASRSTGIRDIRSLCGDSVEEYPLNYTDYNEKYFLDSSDNKDEWTKVDFTDIKTGKTRTDTVSINGNYRENSTGTGDYTKEEQKYYPIRNTEDESLPNNKYRENIESFDASSDGAQSPYYLEFEEVSNDFVNNTIKQKQKQKIIGSEYDPENGKFGYYENVYADLTEEMVNNIGTGNYTFPGENPAKPANCKEIWMNNSTQPDAFSTGDEFTTVEETPVTSDATADFGSSQDNAFSDGDFSSENEGIGGTASSDQNVSQNETAQAADAAGSDTKGDVSDGTQSGNTSAQEMLGQISDVETQSKNPQSDPLIYLGENINAYPYYKYTLVGDLADVKSKAASNQSKDEAAKKNGEAVQRKDGDITLEDGQYWYWRGNNKNDFDKLPLSIVTGLQPVAFSNVQEIDPSITYNYYYRVNTVYFCCTATGDKPEDFQYFGWYYPNYPANEDVYLPVSGNEKPTYYISEAEYKLTPKKGNYDFIPGGDQEQTVQVNHMYYKGGYKNHDWFKRHVFHLSPEDNDETVRKQFENFNIEVETISAEDFNKKYGNATAATSADTTDVASIADGDNAETDNANAQSEEQSADGGEVSEVDSMVSEAGVELVPIENEINDSRTEDFQDGTDTEMNAEETENQQAEVSANDTPDEVFSDDGNDTADVFSAGEADNTTEVENLADYDLIYVNSSTLNAASMTAIASLASTKKLACIINETKLENNTDFATAFSGFIDNEDADNHYVNTCVYFFKNTLQPENPSDLLNVLFDTNFNPDAEEGVYANADQIKGFEEIIKYIEKENKYREIGKDTISDGSQTDDGNNTDETGKNALSKKLSQARVIEYIINYKYKRNDIPTGKIRVLELQPARSSGEITEEEVLNWLGYENKITVTSCCAQTENGEKADNVLKKDNSMWHSAYDQTNHVHWIQLEFEHETDVNGFIYGARKNGKNGILNEYEVEFYNNNKELLQDETKTGSMGYNWNSIDTSYKTITFNSPVKNVKSMKLIFKDTFGNSNGQQNKYASACYIAPVLNQTQVKITTMTTSEFVGHIDDINTNYDMVYLGDDDNDLNYDGNFRPDNKILYYHVGGSKIALYELQGLMNHDYITKADGGKKANTVKTKDSDTGTIVGSVRGSGNDITKQMKSKLVDFAKSGYPVIVAGNIYNSDKSISTELVDDSSYIYDFLNEIKGYSNVYREDEVKGDDDIKFYTELPKPKIEFASENGTPASAIGTSAGPSGNYMSGDNITFNFQIIDEAQASPANASYDCELYIDLNCDGNYAKSEKLKDIIISKDGEVLKTDADGKYHLSLKTSYTVSRKVPDEYIKLMPWKLVVTNNTNSEIRTSEIGYTKRRNTNTGNNTIRVLQIMPNKSCTWNLANDTEFSSLFNAVKEDFDVSIDAVTISQYESSLKNNSAYLDTYNMLIIGFGDGGAYGNDSGNGGDNFTLNGATSILNFANTGKSVIFAHDNTSSSNYDRNADSNISGIWKGWAYYFNKMLRSVSGMDRYGITASGTSDILKKAMVLQDGTEDWNTVSKNAYDMAYELNSNKTKSYSETQGFSNGKLRIAIQDRTSGNTPEVNSVTNVNEGAISEYPYRIDKTFQVANTHMQYYQLAMEEDSDHDGSNDIVVWYCLGNKGTSDSFYDHTPNDVRNNYYIYSYKNIIYTGVGHSSGITNMEKKLFVNTIIAAYNAQAVNPELSFVKESDWNAGQEKSVYYMLDNVNFGDSQELIKDSQDFHLKVTDSNLVGTSFNGDATKDLKLELFIESDSENAKTVEGIGTNAKVEKIEVPVSGTQVSTDADGNTYVYSGNVYDFTLENLQNYLKDNTDEYRGKTTLYARISCKYLYYGVEKEAQSVAKIDICQRQLFDMD